MGCTCANVPSECGPLLLNNLTYLKSTSLGLAKHYRKYGERYHRLPLHIREHEVVPELWKDYCKTAFIVCANRELPDLIQVFGMLESKLESGRVAVFKGEVNAAKREFYITAKLVEEAKDRAAKLKFAVTQYEWLSRLIGEVDEVNPEGEVQKAAMQEAWKMALPKYCGAS